MELPNGCICCTVAGRFRCRPRNPALPRRPPEHILIETSGLALPKPSSGVPVAGDRSRVTVDGVVAWWTARRRRPAPSPRTRSAGRPARGRHLRRITTTRWKRVFEDQLLWRRPRGAEQDRPDGCRRPRKVRAEVQGHLPRAVKGWRPPTAFIDRDVLLGLGAAAEDDPPTAPRPTARARDHEPRRLRDRGAARPRRRDGGRPPRPRREGGRDRGVLRASRASWKVEGKPMPSWCRAWAAGCRTISTGVGAPGGGP